MSTVSSFFRPYSKWIEALNPEAKAHYLSAYRQSIQLTPKPECVKTVDDYLSQRVLYLNSKGVDNSVDGPIQTKLDELRGDFFTIQEHIDNIGAKYHPDLVRAELQEKRNALLKCIDELHGKDKLKAGVDVVELEKRHKETKEQLEKQINEDINKLHDAVNAEQARIATLAFMRQHSEEAKKIIDEMYLSASPSLTASFEAEAGMLKDISLDKLIEARPEFKTVTGTVIRIIKQGDKFSFQAQKTGDGERYYKSDRAKADMMFIAQMAKGSGTTKINWSIPVQKSEKIAMIAARKAYEASLQVGFDEMPQSSDEKDANGNIKTSKVNITIKYFDKNGNEQTKTLSSIKDLYYYDEPHKQTRLQGKYDNQLKSAQAAKETYDRGKQLGGSTKDLKDELARLRAAAPASAAPPTASPSSASPTTAAAPPRVAVSSSPGGLGGGSHP